MLCQLTYPSSHSLGHHSLLLFHVFVVGETSIRAQVEYSHSVQDTRKARFVAICTHLIIWISCSIQVLVQNCISDRPIQQCSKKTQCKKKITNKIWNNLLSKFSTARRVTGSPLYYVIALPLLNEWVKDQSHNEQIVKAYLANPPTQLKKLWR